MRLLHCYIVWVNNTAQVSTCINLANWSYENESLTLKNPSGPVLAVCRTQLHIEAYSPARAFIILVFNTSTGCVAPVATIPCTWTSGWRRRG